MNNDKPLIISLMGFPGSGKTYFSSQLAEALPAVRLNADAIRIAMYGSREKMEEIRSSDLKRFYDEAYGAISYAAKQVLTLGVSVICDAQMLKREDRQRYIEQIAAESNAIPVLVWIRTSKEVALSRGSEREESDESIVFDKEMMQNLIDYFDKRTDAPSSSENVIEISGEMPFPEQLVQFQHGIEEIKKALASKK